MAQNNTLELIGTVLLFLFGVTMIFHGHAIFHGKYGYKHAEREQKRSADIRKELEQILKDK